MKPFIHGKWHAWKSNGKILLSDESTKTLLTFHNTDGAVNWLYTHGDQPAARALVAHLKDPK